jgi:ABC-type transporter Mla MlaB component
MGRHMALKKKPSGGGGSAARLMAASAKARAGQARSRQPLISDRAAPRPQAAAPAVAMAGGQAAASQPGTNIAAATPAAVCAAGPFALGSSLSIREVGERAAQLKALFAAGSAEVDVGKLESIDTAGLQLLLAAAAAARRHGLTLKLLGAERLNSGAAGALGVADHLAAAAEILP